jgi:hypothetical protein
VKLAAQPEYIVFSVHPRKKVVKILRLVTGQKETVKPRHYSERIETVERHFPAGRACSRR